jgi:hypothetical protein
MKDGWSIIIRVALLALGLLGATWSFAATGTFMNELSPAQASHFAALALKCVHQEFPNKPSNEMKDANDAQTPLLLHPAFYGCFDWHSSVHGHWLLARLLKLYPNLPEAAQIRAALDADLAKENLASEADYLRKWPLFERTYGWAWLLKLAEELHGWDDAGAKRWSDNLQPLAEVIVQGYLRFLPKQTYPIRTGVHPNTAFGLAFALDYARAVGNEALQSLLLERSRSYFAADRRYPAAWEPGGMDFFSAALLEADLMRRVLPAVAFRRWLHGFLPELAEGKPKVLLYPATVTDRSDGYLVHLDGLNISRAWCMRSITAALPADDPMRKVLHEAAARHVADALPNVASGSYEGEHWLASFAVYLLSVSNAQ